MGIKPIITWKQEQLLPLPSAKSLELMVAER
jgi:hypothetical protein